MSRPLRLRMMGGVVGGAGETPASTGLACLLECYGHSYRECGARN
ncbi:hypothetical protein [Leptolyngbya sp. GB1-A1]